jgi:hypothetical protein
MGRFFYVKTREGMINFTTFSKSGKINMIRLAPILGVTGNRDREIFLTALGADRK